MNCRVLLCIISLTLAGCSYRMNATDQERVEAGMPVYCQGEEACTRMWEAAAIYIEDNAVLPIERVDDHIISTIPSPLGGARLSLRVQRELMPNPEYSRIWVETSCDNVFGCVPDEIIEKAAIKRFISQKE